MVVPPIAIYGAIATSKSLAKELYDIIDDACKSKEDLKELRDKFDRSKLNYDAMTDVLKEIGDDLRPELADFIALKISELDGKFTKAKTKLETYTRNQRPLITWHFVKEVLTQAIEALSSWTDHFVQLYLLLPSGLQVKFQKRMVSDKFKNDPDGVLQKVEAHVQVTKARLDLDEQDVEKMLATMRDEPPEQRVLDVRRYRYPKDMIRVPKHIQKDEAQLRSFKLEVAKLTAVLGAADPDLTYLPKAVTWFQRQAEGDTTPGWLGIAYEVYENRIVTQIPLKAVINMGTPQHSLSDRIKLAQDFVSAMAYLRGLHWVHKAIQSTNILLCYSNNDREAPQKLGHVNLVGFNVARRGSGDISSWSRDEENAKRWREQVYCHPERQVVNMIDEDERVAEKAGKHTLLLNLSEAHPPDNGSAASSVAATSNPAARLPYYRYMHDIYSIGVVLLELGLWRDLTPNDSALRTAKPEQRQQILLRMVRDELPRTMGEKYASIVKACLEVEDKGPVVAEVLTGLAQIHL